MTPPSRSMCSPWRTIPTARRAGCGSSSSRRRPTWWVAPAGRSRPPCRPTDDRSRSHPATPPTAKGRSTSTSIDERGGVSGQAVIRVLVNRPAVGAARQHSPASTETTRTAPSHPAVSDPDGNSVTVESPQSNSPDVLVCDGRCQRPSAAPSGRPRHRQRHDQLHRDRLTRRQRHGADHHLAVRVLTSSDRTRGTDTARSAQRTGERVRRRSERAVRTALRRSQAVCRRAMASST